MVGRKMWIYVCLNSDIFWTKDTEKCINLKHKINDKKIHFLEKINIDILGCADILKLYC